MIVRYPQEKMKFIKNSVDNLPLTNRYPTIEQPPHIPKLLNNLEVSGENDESKSEEDGEKLMIGNASEVEQVVVSMFNAKESNAVKVMKFKGEIEQIPVCALLDSRSTHSFVNPTVLQGKKVRVVQTISMVVTVANGARMITDLQCEALQFQLQGHEFERDIRVLDVRGYDMILGLDWLTSLDPMKIDWGKGSLEFRQKDKEIRLQVREEKAQIKLCESAINLDKEKKKGSEVIIAHLFKVTKEVKIIWSIVPELHHVLQEFHDVFVEPSTLSPSRSIDHPINLLPNSISVNIRPYKYSYF
jgi:Retroviral aspartyl protease